MSNDKDEHLLEDVSAGYLGDDDIVDCCKCRREILFSQSY